MKGTIFKGILVYIIFAIAFTNVYGEKVHYMQTDDVQLLIIPENQTRFVDETGEYKVIIKISENVGFAMECTYTTHDNVSIPFRTAKYEKYEEIKTYKTMSFGHATTKNFSYNLYCFYVDSAYEKYVWNITKYAYITFISYPINFSVEISNKTYIDCENPYGNITGKILNMEKESISCYYTKIYENGIETKETFSIPSPIQSHETSEFYIDVNLDDIPKKINITCWNAHNEGKNLIVEVHLNANLTTRKKIEKCENMLENLKKISKKENIDADFSAVEEKALTAKRYEKNRGCLAAERYADECVIMLIDINKTISERIKEREKERKEIEIRENLKKNASACIEKLRNEILNLSLLNYGNKTGVFVNSAHDMLKTAEKNFAEEKYNEAMVLCQAGEDDVNMALRIYEEEIKEKEIKEKETGKKEENITKIENKTFTQKESQISYVFIVSIIVLILIILALLFVLYKRYKNEVKK